MKRNEVMALIATTILMFAVCLSASAKGKRNVERGMTKQEVIAILGKPKLTSFDMYEDEMSIERDGLLDMLASLKENKIQYIVVLSTNRLWRSDLVKVLLHRELKKNNVDIRAIDRPNYSVYTQNPSSN